MTEYGLSFGHTDDSERLLIDIVHITTTNHKNSIKYNKGHEVAFICKYKKAFWKISEKCIDQKLLKSAKSYGKDSMDDARLQTIFLRTAKGKGN